MRLDPARAALLGALFAAIVTLPGLGNGTLWDNSETAYGEVAREILLTHDWVVMHLNAQAWFIQPPLYFWIAAAFATVAGPTETAMRLPSALATIAMGAAVGGATARVAGGRAGTIAALVLSTSLMQAIVGRLAIMDALLDLAVTAGLLWWYRALEPGPVGGPRRRPAFVLGAVALALGTLAKGPVAPVIALLVIAAWGIWERRRGAHLCFPAPAAVGLGAALFVAIVTPWFVAEAIRVGPDAARELLGHYTVGRYTGVIENQRGPWWYYVPVLILGFFPWIAFVPAALARALRRARADDAFARFALCWAVVPFVFFSFAQTKLPNYVALLLPALAIIVGRWFGGIIPSDRRAAILSAATIPLFIGALGIGIALFIQENRIEIPAGLLAPELTVLAIAMMAGSLGTVVALAVRRWTQAAPGVLGVTAAALVLFIVFVAEPVAETLKPIPGFARTIQAQRTAATVVAIRNVSGSNGLVFYTRPEVLTEDGPPGDLPRLVCGSGDLLLLTNTGEAAGVEEAARAGGRRASVLGRSARDVLFHVDGPPCRGVTSPR